MFEDAIKGRGFINEEQRVRPLSHEEVATAVRGRHKWNTATKEWEIAYRPYRNHWIVLLLTVQPRIFALPMPKIIPSRIVAQYEIEEQYATLKQMALMQGFTEAQFQASQSMGTVLTRTENNNTVRIQSIQEPLFKRDLTKNEASILPDPGSTIKIAKPKNKAASEMSAYERQINQRIQKDPYGQ